MNYFLRLLLFSLAIGILPASAQAIDITGTNSGVTLELQSTVRTFLVGPQGVPTDVNLWVYCESGSNNTGGCDQSPLDFPGPLLEMGAGLTGSVTLDLTLAASTPREGSAQLGYVANFSGHTMHFANLDLPALNDGVPTPFPPVAGIAANTGGPIKSYNIDLTPTINPNHIGSHAYYCHVHQTKHVEMGEFGALVVHPVKDGKFLSYINRNLASKYDVEANLILSTIDPGYHTVSAVGDNPVFEKYTPSIFLVNGEQGLSEATPAVAITARTGDIVAIRLIGMHAVNATFEILDGNSLLPLPTAQPFTVYNIDGWAQPAPKVMSKVELSPGQTKDILVTMPTSKTTWYPVATYTHLREVVDINGNSTVKVLGKVLSAITIE